MFFFCQNYTLYIEHYFNIIFLYPYRKSMRTTKPNGTRRCTKPCTKHKMTVNITTVEALNATKNQDYLFVSKYLCDQNQELQRSTVPFPRVIAFPNQFHHYSIVIRLKIPKIGIKNFSSSQLIRAHIKPSEQNILRERFLPCEGLDQEH